MINYTFKYSSHTLCQEKRVSNGCWLEADSIMAEWIDCLKLIKVVDWFVELDCLKLEIIAPDLMSHAYIGCVLSFEVDKIISLCVEFDKKDIFKLNLN